MATVGRGSDRDRLGDAVIVVPAPSDGEAAERFPRGFETETPYLRVTPRPDR